jgi:Flp pilus assembly protein TadD
MTLGRTYVHARRPARALAPLRAAVELNPDFALTHEVLGQAYLQLGRPAEALAAFRRAAVLSGPRDSAQLAYALAVTGDRPQAERILRELLASQRRRYLPPVGIALAYVGLGDRDAAFAWLERGVREHAAFMDSIYTMPVFDPLRGDPRWTSLMRRLRATA